MASLSGGIGGAVGGAKLGSSLGPIGTGIGAIAGGLLGTFLGGKPSPEDTAETSILNNVPTLINKGNTATDTALGDLGTSGNFYKTILGGNRDAISNLLAPQTSTILSQYDNASKAIKEFAPRGGGSTQALAQNPYQKATAAAGAYQGVLPSAAQGLSQVGGTTGQIGANLTNQGMSPSSGLIDFKKLEEGMINKAGVGLGQTGASSGSGGGAPDLKGMGKGIGALFGKLFGGGKSSGGGASLGSFGDAGDE